MTNPNDAVALHMRTAEKCAASFGRRYPHIADDLRGVAMLELVRLARTRLELTPWYVCRRLAGAMLDHARAHGLSRSRAAEWPAGDVASPGPSPELGAFARELFARLGVDDERAPLALAMLAAGAELDDVGRAAGLSRAGACRLLQRARARAVEDCMTPIDTTGEGPELSQAHPPSITRGAIFSPDNLWRYRLFRRWGEGPAVCFVMLNPSTADDEKDDPTIRRCMGFASSWGYHAIDVVNLSAWRSTEPRGLRALRGLREHIGGPDNDANVNEAVERAPLVVAAWGAAYKGNLTHRPQTLVPAVYACGKAKCLGLTTGGDPRHPLYAPATSTLKPFP